MADQQGGSGDGNKPESQEQAGAPRRNVDKSSSAANASVLYSLDALTAATAALPKDKDDQPPESGTIDLTKLPKASEARVAPAILDAVPALGSAEPDEPAQEAPKQKSRAGLGIGIGLAVAGVAIAGAIVYAIRQPQPLPATSPTVSASAAPTLTASASASVSAAPAETASAAPSASAPKPVVAKGGPVKKAPTAENTAAPDPTPTPTPTPKPVPVSPCGCKPEDLQCNMSCAVQKK